MGDGFCRISRHHFAERLSGLCKSSLAQCNRALAPKKLLARLEFTKLFREWIGEARLLRPTLLQMFSSLLQVSELPVGHGQRIVDTICLRLHSDGRFKVFDCLIRITSGERDLAPPN